MDGWKGAKVRKPGCLSSPTKADAPLDRNQASAELDSKGKTINRCPAIDVSAAVDDLNVAWIHARWVDRTLERRVSRIEDGIWQTGGWQIVSGNAVQLEW